MSSASRNTISGQDVLGFPITSFPSEIVSAIIDQLEDSVSTLSNLCVAARGNAKVLQPALKKRWQKTVIDDRDLVPAPNDDSAEIIEKRLMEQDFAKNWKPRGQGIYSLLEEVRPNLRAAAYVQDLTIDMRMVRYLEPEARDAEIQARDLIPSSASLKYSFNLIKPHLTALQSLEWRGDLRNGGLELVTHSNHCSKIKSLEVQRLHSDTRLRRQEQPGWIGFMQHKSAINYDDLGNLSNLRSLSIYRLAAREASPLLSCLPLLFHLEILVIADEELDSIRPVRVCGLRKLMQQLLLPTGIAKGRSMNEVESRVQLPASLVSLTLIERHMDGYSTVPDITTRSVTLKNSLQILNIITEGSDPVAQLAASLVNASVERLMIPGAAYPPQNRRYHWQLDSLISKHISTLSRITLLNAWNLDDEAAKIFHQIWKDRFEIRELVLGTSSKSWSYQEQPEWRQTPSPVIQRYLDGFDGKKPDLPAKVDLWGDRLERIRLDDMRTRLDGTKTWMLDTTILGHPRFSQLKILMLQPFDEGAIPVVESHMYFHGCEHIEEFSARALAQQIFQVSSPTLRIIIIQNYWYWTSTASSNEEIKQLWRWEDAEGDTNQSKVMANVLTTEDWLFLKNDSPPFWNARFRGETRRIPNLHGWSNDSANFISRRWNYLTAFSVASYGGRGYDTMKRWNTSTRLD